MGNRNLQIANPEHEASGPSDSQTLRLSDPQTLRPSDPQTLRLSDPQTFRPSDPQTLRLSDPQIELRLKRSETPHTECRGLQTLSKSPGY